MLPTGYHKHPTSVTSSEGDKGRREQSVSMVGLQQYPSWLCVAAFFRVLTRGEGYNLPPVMSGNPNTSHIPTQKPSHRRVGVGDKQELQLRSTRSPERCGSKAQPRVQGRVEAGRSQEAWVPTLDSLCPVEPYLTVRFLIPVEIKPVSNRLRNFVFSGTVSSPVK